MAKRYFNTSGPNNPEKHYTCMREGLIEKGLNFVKDERYFTIWSPRQSGKSTYFRLLAKKLECEGYKVTHINVENFQDATKDIFLRHLGKELKNGYGLDLKFDAFSDLFDKIKDVSGVNCVFIIDEIEGLNEEIFNQFLHTIRNLYHSREEHCMKSVILVGVSNITGIAEDSASPFNIADTLEVPYFTKEEVYELLDRHEEETGQRFEERVQEKIYSITSGQPGLVNGFSYKLVEMCVGREEILYDDYLIIEDWYLKVVIDKNIANVISKAKKYRDFVERLLFREESIEFDIERESIKFLHANGVINRDKDGYVEFRAPLYKKKLYRAFYPHVNGDMEREKFFIKGLLLYIREDGAIDFDRLIDNFKEYVKRRSFRYFREKDEETGKFKQIKEATLVYTFETYIQSFIQSLGGKSYLEAHTGLGRSDLIINVNNREYVVEAKIYRDEIRFEKGKKQLAYYCDNINIKEGIYLVFVPSEVEIVKEGKDEIKGVLVRTYIVRYDEEKDF